MHSIAAEVPKEILMLFEHRNRYTLTSQQIAQHDARRTAAYNATCGFQWELGHRSMFLSRVA
jgi:hypothetical protein